MRTLTFGHGASQRRAFWHPTLVLLGTLLGACAGEDAGPDDATSGGAGDQTTASVAASFPDEALARGLVWHNRSGSGVKELILEANGAGVALLDLGADGDLDVVLGQGLESIAALLEGPGAALGIFENDGGGNFERAPENRVHGQGVRAWWTGLATGDLEGDGDTDLVAGAFGDLAVLRQIGGGELERVPPHAAGLWPAAAMQIIDDSAENLARTGLLIPGAKRPEGSIPLWHTSLALFDANRDGNLDLYAGRYLALDPAAAPSASLGEGALSLPCAWKGYRVFCGPRGLKPQPDSIYEGLGNGTFVERSATWLPRHVAGFTLAVTAFDADMDGDTDLHVANDSVPDLLLWNTVLEGGGMRDIGSASGIAVSPDGLAEAGMGAGIGDLDRDGRFDIAVANFSGEPAQLYLALSPRSNNTDAAPQRFRNISYATGLASQTRAQLSWSTHLTDFDLDGRLELYLANGHVYPQADQPGTGTTYGQADSLFSFDENLRAVPVFHAPGDALGATVGTRGVALGDLDGDGAADLVLGHIDAPVALAMNRSAGDNHRLVLRCEGPLSDAHGKASPSSVDGQETEDADAVKWQTEVAWRTPRDGMGTRVICVPALPAGAESFALLGEVQTSRGFQSASSAELIFGLGSSDMVQELTILWPSGALETLRDVAADQRLVIREGEGIVLAEDLQ